MANYAVFLQGSDFELSRSGGKESLGFFVTIRVEAPSEQDAASSAIEHVKIQPQLQEAYSASINIIPDIEVKVVHELPQENKMRNTEFIFFPMEEE